jgi:hypothetical protein
MGQLASAVSRSLISAQVQVVLVVAGLACVVIAILGSGDFVRVVIPELKRWARISLAAIGVLVFAFAFIPELISSPSGPANAASTPSATSQSPSARGTVTPTPSPTPSGLASPMPPKVTISSPPNGAHLPNNTFGTSGIAEGVPSGDDLWLVVKPPDYDRWYPVSRINVVGGAWTIGAGEICPAGGRQDIEVFMVPNIAEAQLTAYVSYRTSQHDPGIKGMPTLATLEAVSHVSVNSDSTKSC